MLSYLDLFGSIPNLRILKTPQFTSKLGYAFSILIVCICAQAIYTQLSTLLARINPQIVVTENYGYDTQPFPLLKSNFTLGVLLVNSKLEQLQTMGTHWTLDVKSCNRVKLNSSQIQGGIPQLNCTSIPIEPCGQQHIETNVQKEYYQHAKLGHVYCMNSEYWDQHPPLIQGTVQGWNHSYLTVTISKCKNTTTYDKCASEEEIQKELENGYFAIQIMNNLVKMSLPDTPFQEFISLYDNTFSANTSKTIFTYLQIIESITDVGLFAQQEITDNRLAVYSSNESPSEYNGEYIIHNYIRLQPRSTSYHRSYQRIQNIVGNIGGLWQAVYLILSLVLKPLTNSLMNLAIANKLFRFESEQEVIASQIQSPRKIDISNFQINIDNVLDQDLPQNEEQRQDSSQRQYIKQQSINFEQFKDQGYLKQFLKARNKKIQLNFKDQFLYLFGCKKKLKRQIQYATIKFKSQLDLAFIINKIHEIDKLKNILLTRDQLNLFNYLPKPVIPSNLIELNQNTVEKQNSAYGLILQDEKSTIIKLQEAYTGYCNIKNKLDKTIIDNQLIDHLDEEIQQFFDKIERDQHKFNIIFKSSPIITSRLNELDKQKEKVDQELIS